MRAVAILRAASSVLTFLLVIPPMFLLVYLAMEHIKATPLMWFLFWVYVPATAVCGALDIMVTSLLIDGPRDWHERWRDE